MRLGDKVIGPPALPARMAALPARMAGLMARRWRAPRRAALTRRGTVRAAPMAPAA